MGRLEIEWTSHFYCQFHSLVLSVACFKKMDIVESTKHLYTNIPALFLVTELLHCLFNFLKSLVLH